MGRIRVEFTVAPFTEGETQPHIQAAHDALLQAGLTPDNGPFGTAVEGEAATVLRAVAEAVTLAFNGGGTDLAMQARTIEEEVANANDFVAAVRPAVRALGAQLVPPSQMSADDIPLRWQGELVAAIRSPPIDPDLHVALGKLVAQVEAEVGGSLADLPRDGKQRAVRLLAERGAFTFRNAVDEIADALGTSRMTVYNYLNATRRDHSVD